MKPYFLKHIFWVLQLLGWGAFALFSLAASGMAKNYIGMLLLLMPLMFSGILTTSVLRWFLKRYISLKIFSFSQLLLLLFIVACGVFLFAQVSYGFGLVTSYSADWFIADTTEVFNDPPTLRSSKYIGYSILVIGWTVLYFGLKILRNYNASRLDRLRLKDEIRQAQLNTLKGHINPQFMFTSLNNIKSLMLEDIGKSRVMLTKLSEMLRYSLTKNNVNAISIAEELEILESYTALLEIEGRERLSLVYAIDPHVQNREIPPMMLINLFEMATKHGVLRKREGGEVKITIESNTSTLSILASFIGKSPSSDEFKTLEKIIAQRLRLLYNAKARYTNTYKNNQTELLIVLPNLTTNTLV